MKWCGAEILTQHLPDNQAEINRLGTKHIILKKFWLNAGIFVEMGR